MQTHMKTRTIGASAEIVVTVPAEHAVRIAKAINDMLTKQPIAAREVNADGEELYTPQEVFPEAHPGMVLQGIRGKEGLTQEEMSMRLNITQSRLSELETGKRAISKDMARRIGTAFNLDYRMFL